ncbi:Protein GAMETE EXPRESSED 2 [Carex littledalei]|uniref:Protein GAMETE EXPRESSED 2 n=1 Tax=Carex littledalei TaxID=544730 RepID=A0A833QK14_9POAL|nr:Protein GAMETE EXPRESSED 2 [Carex littledalei]
MRYYCLIQCALLWILTITVSQAANGHLPAKALLPNLTFSWLDDKSAFLAGDVATIKVKLLQSLFSGKMVDLSQHSMAFSVSVNGKKGNSSFISGICSNTEGDPTGWNITFIPIMAGDFGLVIEEIHLGIVDSSLHFSVTPGHIYPSGCTASWLGYNAVLAGTKASILVLPIDAFGNNLEKGVPGPSDQYFNLSVSYENGLSVHLGDFKYQGWKPHTFF